MLGDENLRAVKGLPFGEVRERAAVPVRRLFFQGGAENAVDLPPAFGEDAPTLCGEGIGDDPMIAQDLRRPRRRAIEEAASVFCPVRAEAVDLQGQTIVQVSAHRPPHDGDARQMAVRHAAQGELIKEIHKEQVRQVRQKIFFELILHRSTLRSLVLTFSPRSCSLCCVLD